MSPDDMAALHAAAFSGNRAWNAEEFAGLLASPNCFAVGDRRAFALGRTVADEAELLTVATDPRHRRQGLAAACLAAWRAEARARGAERGFLEVAADNGPALALYRAFGFAPCGTRPGYYRDANRRPVDAVLMTLSLTTG